MTAIGWRLCSSRTLATIRAKTNAPALGSPNPPGNEKELTLAIAMLLRDPRRRASLGISARDTVLDSLTLAHQADVLLRIYRESMQ